MGTEDKGIVVQNIDNIEEKMKELKVHADVLADTNHKVAQSMKMLQENVGDVRNITKTIFAISSSVTRSRSRPAFSRASSGTARWRCDKRQE